MKRLKKVIITAAASMAIFTAGAGTAYAAITWPGSEDAQQANERIGLVQTIINKQRDTIKSLKKGSEDFNKELEKKDKIIADKDKDLTKKDKDLQEQEAELQQKEKELNNYAAQMKQAEEDVSGINKRLGDIIDDESN